MALTIIPITYKSTPVPLYQGTNFFGSLSIFDIATNWMQSKKSIVKAIKYIFTLDKLTSNSVITNDNLSLKLFIKPEYLPIEMPDNIEVIEINS